MRVFKKKQSILMKQKQILTAGVSPIGMIVVLLVAYGLERGLEELRMITARNFDATPFLWVSSIANLLLAGLLLTLSWLINFRSERSWFIALMFLIVGTVIAFSLAIADLTHIALFIPILRYVSPDSRLVYAAAFIAVVGAFNLIPRKE
jgi:hypothetical protein